MERDPYYLFNNAMGQITPDCCQFLEDLAKCLSSDMGRTREKRERQLGTGVSTRLVFMPDFNRDIRKPLDVTKEAMIVHLAAIRGAGCRSLESEGGTHADALWFGWLHLASRSDDIAGLFLRPRGLCQATVE